MKDLKVVFMGTPEFSVPLLRALIETCKVVGVVCQPDKVKDKFLPVKKVAIENNIPVFQPIKIREDYQSIINLHPDVIITCAYGQIIPKILLDTPKYKSINVHASLLPKLRGGAPLHRAIMTGQEKTGITIMYMSERLDAGAIISQEETIIGPNENVGSLHDRLSIMGRDLLLKTLPNIITGNITPIKQNEMDATYATNITRDDEHIDFTKSKREIYNKIRGLNPWPGAYCKLENKVIKVWDSRTGDKMYFDRFNGEIVALYEDGIGVKTDGGEIIFTELHLEGHHRMKVKDFLNGLKDKDLLIGKIFD